MVRPNIWGDRDLDDHDHATSYRTRHHDANPSVLDESVCSLDQGDVRDEAKPFARRGTQRVGER